MQIVQRIFSVIILMALIVSAPCVYGQDSLMKQAQAVFKAIPETPPQLAHNPLTPAKIELGKILFMDPRLSRSALISCNTCHNLGLGGADFQETSTGHGWRRGARNSPTVFNAVFNIAQFWDGRAGDLMEQAKGPVQAGVEMNNSPEQAVRTLKSMPGYVKLFQDAFGSDPDPVTFDNMAKAIEAFEATLITPDSAFDTFLKGDAGALAPREKEGLALYIQKGCAACHGGVNLGGSGYFPFGVFEKPKDDITAGDMGRYTFTGVKADQNVFKSPSLRNIELTPPYFHSGKVWGLKESVAIMGSAQLGISLTDADVDRIVDFLKTTTGVLPTIEYPILPKPTRDTPRPVLE